MFPFLHFMTTLSGALSTHILTGGHGNQAILRLNVCVSQTKCKSCVREETADDEKHPPHPPPRPPPPHQFFLPPTLSLPQGSALSHGLTCLVMPSQPSLMWSKLGKEHGQSCISVPHFQLAIVLNMHCDGPHNHLDTVCHLKIGPCRGY